MSSSAPAFNAPAEYKDTDLGDIEINCGKVYIKNSQYAPPADRVPHKCRCSVCDKPKKCYTYIVMLNASKNYLKETNPLKPTNMEQEYGSNNSFSWFYTDLCSLKCINLFVLSRL